MTNMKGFAQSHALKGGERRPQKLSFQITNYLANCSTMHLLNTRMGHYHYTNLFGTTRIQLTAEPGIFQKLHPGYFWSPNSLLFNRTGISSYLKARLRMHWAIPTLLYNFMTCAYFNMEATLPLYFIDITFLKTVRYLKTIKSYSCTYIWQKS